MTDSFIHGFEFLMDGTAFCVGLFVFLFTVMYGVLLFSKIVKAIKHLWKYG